MGPREVIAKAIIGALDDWPPPDHIPAMHPVVMLTPERLIEFTDAIDAALTEAGYAICAMATDGPYKHQFVPVSKTPDE